MSDDDLNADCNEVLCVSMAYCTKVLAGSYRLEGTDEKAFAKPGSVIVTALQQSRECEQKSFFTNLLSSLVDFCPQGNTYHVS